MPATPDAASASRTSSHLCGLMTAVTSFISDSRLHGGSAGTGVVVRGLEVLGLVDAGDLDLLVDPEPDGHVDQLADDVRQHERVDQDGTGRDGLLAQLARVAAVEQTGRIDAA